MAKTTASFGVPPHSLVSHLRQNGVNEDGMHWIAKALHPPGTKDSCAIPDDTVVCSTCPEFRRTVVIQAPPSLPGPSWDLLIVKMPGDGYAARYCAAPGGTDFKSVPTGHAGCAVGAVPTQAFEIAPGRSMSGINFGANITPATDLLYYTAFPAASPSSWRIASSSITAYLTASATTDQGTVYGTSVPREYLLGAPQAGAFVPEFSTTERPVYREVNVTLPLNEADMFTLDPKVYSAPARCGAYIPSKHFGTFAWRSPDYMKGEVFYPKIYGGTSDAFFTAGPSSIGFARQTPLTLNPVVSTYTENVGWQQTFCFFDPSAGDAIVPPDTAFDDWSTSIIMFRGLDPSSTVTLRLHDAIQQLPQATSVYTPFVRDPAVHSSEAMDLYMRITALSPSVYPADYNSWGKVWSVIERVAKDLWPHVVKAVPRIVDRLLPEAGAAAAVGAPRVTYSGGSPMMTNVPVTMARRTLATRSGAKAPTKKRR